MKKCIVGLLAVILVVLIASPFSLASGTKTIKMKWAHVLAPTEPTHIVAREVAKRVKERTNGGIEITVYPSSQLGFLPDVFEQIKLGAPIIAHIEPSWAADLGSPNLAATQGPFLIENYDEFKKLIDSDLMKKWSDILIEKAGVRIMTWNWYFGPRHIISNRGYMSPDDLKGVKVRCPPSTTWVNTFKVLGATPVTLAWGEVYTGLSQGVVDAAEAPLSTLLGSKLYEPSKVITLTGHFKAINCKLINEKFFKSLPEEWQQILKEEITKCGEMMSKMTVENQRKFKEDLAAKGVKFVEPEILLYKAKSKDFYTMDKRWPPDIYDQMMTAIKGN